MNVFPKEHAVAQYPVQLVAVTCGGCQLIFGMPKAMYTKCREEGLSFRCPNPRCSWDSQSYTETKMDRLERELEEQKADAEYWRKRKIFEQNQREAAERSAAAYKGHLTRTKRRVAAGVCPCCRRNFENLASHMETQHPGYGKNEDD